MLRNHSQSKADEENKGHTKGRYGAKRYLYSLLRSQKKLQVRLAVPQGSSPSHGSEMWSQNDGCQYRTYKALETQ